MIIEPVTPSVGPVLAKPPDTASPMPAANASTAWLPSVVVPSTAISGYSPIPTGENSTRILSSVRLLVITSPALPPSVSVAPAANVPVFSRMMPPLSSVIPCVACKVPYRSSWANAKSNVTAATSIVAPAEMVTAYVPGWSMTAAADPLGLPGRSQWCPVTQLPLTPAFQ